MALPEGEGTRNAFSVGERIRDFPPHPDNGFSITGTDSIIGIILLTFLALIFIVGFLRIIGIIVSHYSAARWIREAEVIDKNNDVVSLCRSIGNKFRLNRTVRLLQHSEAKVPLVVSIGRPTIILPFGFEGRPREELEAVLTHEFAHIRRNDLAWQLVVQWAAVLHWYHPLFWYARYRMRQEQEATIWCSTPAARRSGTLTRCSNCRQRKI
jgi:beta-lactamase regulating signal transducer with metallopeptidase domain